MNYPILTRLGMNQFWYRHWYSDITYTKNLQIDKLLSKAVHVYLTYGCTSPNNRFVHEYWYYPYSKKKRIFNDRKHKNLFYRQFSYTNEPLSIHHTFLLRSEVDEYFSLKTWLLKFRGWFILSVHWFKPAKRTYKKMYLSRINQIGGVSLTTNNKPRLKRLKLLYLLLTSYKIKNKNYIF